jgi:chromosome segregation ATPase
VLLNGTTDDVAALDHRIAVTKIRLDQLQVQHAAALIAEAQAQAAHETEQKRRKDLHRKAVKASAEVEKLAAEYVAEAQRLVPLLAKIRERAALIEAANFALPDGADPVPPGEPRCSWEDRPDQPHSSIASRVRLPGLDRATPIW